MGMEIKELYYAKVIDNIYKDINGILSENGRIKIQVKELHENTTIDLLPWARPFSLSTGGSNLNGVSTIPEIDSNIWIFFSDEHQGIYKKAFYIADGSLDSFNPHSLFKNNVASKIGSSSTYPNAKYYYFKNGICVGVDSSTTNPEIFIYHPSAYFFIDKNGVVTIKAGSTTTQKMSLGENVSALLGAILDGIVSHTHPTAAIGSPSPPTNAATFTALKTQYIGNSAPIPILSPNIKNN